MLNPTRRSKILHVHNNYSKCRKLTCELSLLECECDTNYNTTIHNIMTHNSIE